MTRRVIYGILVLLITGCGPSNPYPITKVTGTIKYEDGSLIPASRIELKFVPLVESNDPKHPPKMGIAEVDVRDGSFSTVSTYDYGDGILKGEHKVLAMAMDEANQILPAIPADHHSSDTTPLRINTTDNPLEILVTKP